MDQGANRQPSMPGAAGGGSSPPGPGTAFRQIVGLFGIIWLINAAFQFSAWVWQPLRHGTPHGAGGLAHVLAKSIAGAPAWLRPCVQAISRGIDAIGPVGIAGGMVVVALLLSLALFCRVGLRTACGVGIAYSVFCWIALGALGTPYGHGQTDPGVFPAYLIAFVFVLSLAPMVGGGPAHVARAARPQPAIWTLGRLLFGLLWLFDAALKWEPYFLTHFLGQLTPAVQGQPAWIAAYIGFVILVVKAIGPEVVAVIVAIVETAIALSLLTGRWLRLVVPLGFFYALAVWTTAEGWGGPYTANGTGTRGDVLGNVLIYAVIFLFLLVPVTQPARFRR